MKKLLLLSFLLINFLGDIRSQVVINEISASNLSQYVDNHSDYGDWIELYNIGSTTKNLAGYFLSDDTTNNLKWEIPAGISIPGNGFIRFWASGRNEVASGHYHTNFKLKQTKNTTEMVVFSHPLAGILDSVTLKKTQLGHSFGRLNDGVNAWAIFKTPTLNASNNAAIPYVRYADRPDFSFAGGFYPDTITVTITSTDTGSVIRYTTDGKLPTTTSPQYTGPITISSTKVLKAIAFNSNTSLLTSYVEFATYFINVNHTLPVVSIAGTQVNDLANGNGNLVPFGSFEYFDVNKLLKSRTYGEFNKHGQDSWPLSQRSLDFISRDEMGYNHSIEEQLFNTSDRKNFQRVILRASGDDNYPADHNSSNAGSAHVRDAYIHNMVIKKGLNLDVRRGSKIIVYINGQYWGVYDVRENPDEHDFTDYYYGQDKFKLQYIETWGNTWAEYGGQPALDDWRNFYNAVLSPSFNLTADSNYQWVTDRLDVTSLVDYVLVNMFTVCSDWLNWNTGVWRGLDSTGQHKRWGYILWDNDATFGFYINYTGIPDTSPDANPCDPEGLTFTDDDQNAHISMINKLRTNPTFNQYYINRQLDLWNTIFSCDYMLAQLDSTVALIDPEMSQHAARWSGTYTEWKSNVQQLRDFITQRCVQIANGYGPCYSLTGPYDLVINANPPTAGYVQLNSLTIDSFPWAGQYFGGINNSLEVFPDSVSLFKKWTDYSHPFTPNDSASAVTISLTTSDTVTANFISALKVAENTSGLNNIHVYPTVFSEKVNFSYEIADAGNVEIKLVSVLGEEIAAFNAPGQPGKYQGQLDFSKKNLSMGMYFLRFETKNFRKNIKIMYVPK